MSYQGPGRYRHYKGGEYEVLGLGLEEATKLPVVIYRPVRGWPTDVRADAEFWTRPLDDFDASVVKTLTAAPVLVPRFERVQP